ncbi:hypothetical protein D3C73_1430140 [compost metagenome]
MPVLAEQGAQNTLLEITQVVGALGQQRVAECLQNFALRLDRLTPGVGRGAVLVDGLVGGLQQCRVLE